MRNKISVCMATYNGEKYLKKQVSSIVEQLATEDEIIVSDNGSTDASIEILKGFNDPRIKIFIFQDKKGPIWNFENALTKATGEYIFLADQDDVWEVDRLQNAVAALETNMLVVCNCKIINGAGDVIQKETFFEFKHSGPGLIKNLISNTFLGCCMGFRKELLNKILPFPNDIPMHDWWIGVCAEAYGSTYFIPTVGMYYRRHGENASSASEKSSTTLKQKFIFRFSLVKALLLRKLKYE